MPQNLVPQTISCSHKWNSSYTRDHNYRHAANSFKPHDKNLFAANTSLEGASFQKQQSISAIPRPSPSIETRLTLFPRNNGRPSGGCFLFLRRARNRWGSWSVFILTDCTRPRYKHNWARVGPRSASAAAPGVVQGDRGAPSPWLRARPGPGSGGLLWLLLRVVSSGRSSFVGWRRRGGKWSRLDGKVSRGPFSLFYE